MEKMAVESGEILEPQDKGLNRKQLAWGIFLLAVAVIFGLGAGWLWARSEQLWSSGQIVYFILPGRPLVFCGLLVSGLWAVAGLLCLVPKMILGIKRKGMRVFVRILVHLCITAASLVWLYFWLLSGINSVVGTYHKVTAETGENIVVYKPGFDPASFAVYAPASAFVYERIDGISGMAQSGHFVADHCTLQKQDADLILTCGVDVTKFPNPSN
ncbi:MULTISPECIES: hypothetical protein [Glutamicibacter]|uniref:Uncharacterized protein n=1 Tax=Glutamicibacter halophytocola TaxID=1933880 RepID=A0AA94XSW5_9MICC|nr:MULTISPECIES: hypothetical protein [Glutamicibacter]MBF6671955.1 hypothetical protein [Glutamicibacter sp. FBE19]NQD39703.1 hypothetical protein [Glutamicibacter halophytocola]UUX59419.1 hypothetical protein NUH22_01910 [Glutamicibacter halophytocola]